MTTTAEVQHASAIISRLYTRQRYADVLVVRDPGSPGNPIEPNGVHRICTASFVPEFVKGATAARFDAIVIDMEIDDLARRDVVVANCREVLKPHGVLFVRGLGGPNSHAEMIRTGISYTPVAGYGALLATSCRTQAFQQIYALDIWNGGSGPGSSVEATHRYRQILAEYLAAVKQRAGDRIPKICDIGCGDWQFSQVVDWTGLDYLGLDACQSVIEDNARKFSAPNVKFEHRDAVEKTDWPAFDLVIAKDVFQHLPIASVTRLLTNLERSGNISLLLSTNDDPLGEALVDCTDGGYRPFKLSALSHFATRKVDQRMLPEQNGRPKLAELFQLCLR